MPTKFLTKEGFQKLQEELDQLRTVKRQEVADRLHEAMEGGELIENAEYEAAKNEQAFVEGRIQELEMLLATARVIEEEERNHREDQPEENERRLIGADLDLRLDVGRRDLRVAEIDRLDACAGR